MKRGLAELRAELTATNKRLKAICKYVDRNFDQMGVCQKEMVLEELDALSVTRIMKLLAINSVNRPFLQN